MDTSGTLKFDKKKVNTDLAVKYLEENNEFYPILNDYKSSDFKCSDYVTDNFSYKLYSIPKSYEELKRCCIAWNFQSQYHLRNILIKLSKVVEENAELFAQLEYITRKIPVDDTKSQMWLIAQNLLCCGKQENWRLDVSNEDDIYYSALPMAADTPLLCLGCVAQKSEEKGCLLILATKETAVVCHLFTKLCHDVGLNGINFVFMENIPENLHQGNPKANIEHMMGSTGVITEKADLDSAVDVFLTTTTMSPWRIRRILVQECIYDDFKKVVEWKCSLKNTKPNELSIIFQKLCTNLLAYDEKLLLIDYAGPEPSAKSDPRLIFIEAYRTTKELISLIKSYNVPYLSLWSNHISEANEVAFNTQVPIVWINDFGRFYGPPKVSQAIYSKIFMIEQNAVNISDYDIVGAHKSWISLTLEKRREIMLKTLEKFISEHENEIDVSPLWTLQNALINWDSDEIFVSKDNMCVCMNIPVGIVYAERFMNSVPFLRSVVSGNGVIFNGIYFLVSFIPLVEAFQTAGVPVTLTGGIGDTRLSDKVVCDQKFVTRVVWTNFESIFAN